MTAVAKEKREVTLPEGISLRRVAQVLLDAWEADPRRWMNAPAELREGASQSTGMPVPQFQTVADKFATVHSFAESNVPAATVEGLIVLKLYALPSLYRQFQMDRAALYENDITMLMANHSPVLEPLIALATHEMEPGDKDELKKIISECSERAKLLRQRTGH